MSPAVFSVTRNGLPLLETHLDSALSSSAPTPVSELQMCGFELTPREPDTTYSISIGDLEPVANSRDSRSREGETGLGRAIGPNVYWEDATYFESARGVVVVWLRSRPADSKQEWEVRARLRVLAVPTKLGESRYLAMFEQLRSIAAGLLFDLLSKTLRDVDYVPAAEARPSYRSSQLELRAIEQTWRMMAQGLQAIERDPVLRLQRTPRIKPSWLSHPLRARALSYLVRSGIDVRSRHTIRPIPLMQDDLAESPATTEHRIILGFLVSLSRRVRECGKNAIEQMELLERQRPLRDVSVEPGPTLFDAHDRPRIERLRDAILLAENLDLSLRRAARVSILRGLQPSYRYPSSAVFNHVPPYRQICVAMTSYLNSSLVILDQGTSERIKSTSRMYEHWVFFQIVAALRHAGMECEDVGDMLRRLGMHRFTLDLDERTKVILRSPTGGRVIARYEPWVLPKTEARNAGETIYRGRTGATSWRPDIILEFLPTAERVETAATKYAVVVDAKYTKEVRDRHWAVAEKYAEIRAVRDDRQVVRQVWLAYPGRDGITCRDAAVTWTTRGPDRPSDETIFGTLSLLPPELESEAQVMDAEINPVLAAQQFARGLLHYTGVIEN